MAHSHLYDADATQFNSTVESRRGQVIN